MDWNKLGAIGSLGSFIIGGILFVVQVWPGPQIQARFRVPSDHSSPVNGIGLLGWRAIGILLVVGFLLAAFSLYASWTPKSYPIKWTMTRENEQVIYGRIYRNETVEIDGKKFDHCQFENATLLYHAVAPVDFLNDQFRGTVLLKTDNDAAKGFLKLATDIQTIPGIAKVMVGEVDKNGNITPYAQTNESKSEG